MKPGDAEPTVDTAAPPTARPKVIAKYFGYKPPFNVTSAVEQMLESVPPKCLVGLSEVVLTNTASLSRKRRRSVTKSRKRKVRIVEARGLYHRAWHGHPAWIEIYVDNILFWMRGWWRWWLVVPVLRSSRLAGVLFHEIGHHIHATVQPEFRDKEDVADVWKVRLRRIYNMKRPWWVRALLSPLSIPFRIFGKRLDRWRLRKGFISQAEFGEWTRKGSFKEAKIAARKLGS
jgi:hypothetical protein